jgi:amino acid adenylation domain-containing protein/non-ribosomal peptide synthase protein (TIGR01720 family)
VQQELIQGYRLSPQQTHLWLLQQQGAASVAYGAFYVATIKGVLDTGLLRQALDYVVAQHEILRTTFRLLPGMTIPVQVIEQESLVSLETNDLSAFEGDDQIAQLDNLILEATLREIDYSHVPLFSASLVRQTPITHQLILTAPALCADTQSLHCLVRQLAAVYASYSRGEAPPNNEAMQYADFAEWQNELLEAEEGSVARQYWRKQDLSELATQRLSFEKRVKPEQSFWPAQLPVEISAETSARIKAVANRADVSVSSFALACCQLLISRLTGRSNVVVGAAFDGRKFTELEDAVGLFSRFLPTSGDLPANLSFETLLQQTSEQEKESQRWQEYFAWDDVVSTDKATAPFFPFCFEFWKPAPTDSAAGLEFSTYKHEAHIDRFSIKFHFDDCEDRLSASLQFDSRLFSNHDVQRLADQLKTLIEDASSRTAIALGELELLSTSERQLLLLEFNDTRRQYSTGESVHELFEQQAAQRPDQIAVICEAERLTYRDLNARANQLARYLLKLGVGPDVIVGLCLDRSVDLIEGLLGILKAGGAYVPLDPGLPKARLDMILEEAGARVLVTRSKLTKIWRAQVNSVVCLDTDGHLIANESIDGPLKSVSNENLAYVIFTSGSTGRPKGVAVEHRQLINYLEAIWEKLDLPPGSSFATASTIAADLGNTALFPSLCKGGTLHLIAEERATDPDALAEYFSRNQIDCLKIVPAHMAALLSASKPAGVVPRRRLVFGGEACPWSLVEKIQTLAPDCIVLNHYGPTEATVGAIANRLSGEDAVPMSDTVPLGRPLANMRVYVLDKLLRPVPIGAPGELHIGGAGLARGYINRADATAEKFIPSPFSDDGERLYKTGDLARYLGDGRIEFLGRTDDQLKIRGFRIEPGEIEIALRNHAEITESVVVAREDNHADRRLVAYVVAREREKLSAGELRAFLSGRLPEYMTPSAFVFLDRLPLTRNGKVDRRALPAPDPSRADGDKGFAAPGNQVEETLARIWSDVLGVERVGVHDNFFDLGGDSILSIQIIARANQAGLGLAPRQLFQHQTVAELATVAKVATQTRAEQGTVTGRVPLTPVQARFFELDQPELHHYNQSMLLKIHGPADASLFAGAIELLLIQHDTLRLRYANNNDAWQQILTAPDGVVPFEKVDLSAFPESEQKALVADHAARLHASLNLEEGPLMRVALFDRGTQRNSYLFIVVHHLAVDGVSWRILLEDLQALYRQISSGEKPSLPAKTTSFKSWAERLTEHARAGGLRDELSYWCATVENSTVRLPLDHVGGSNTAASARTLSVSLNVDETRTLLQVMPAVYRTQINEVLLTALVRALSPWTGSRSLLVDLEGHGREEILEGVDLSRTVGWFTTIFPVVLDCGDAQTAVDALRSVKEQLRAIPNRGIGYGLLRYAADDGADAKRLASLPQAEVRFNYLGQVDRALLDSSMFTVASQSTGPAQSLKAQRTYLLNVIGTVSGGELRLEWTYSENIHTEETILRLAHSYIEELRELITQARAGDNASYSPSDFPQAKLSQEDLNKVLARLGGIGKETRK